MAFAFLLTFFSSADRCCRRRGARLFRRPAGYFDAAVYRNLGIFAAAFYPDYRFEYFPAVFLDAAGNSALLFLDFADGNGTGGVHAHRNFEFVKAARVLGVGNLRIIYRHILPNALVSAVTFIPFILSEAVVALTALDFLGLGLSHEYPSLGDLVRQGKDNLQAPWIGISIFVVLSVLLTLLIFVGEGVRDALDTRKNRR